VKKFFIATLIICSTPVFGDIWEIKKIIYTPYTLESITIPSWINKKYFGREDEEKQFYYSGKLKDQKGTTIFLLGAKTWDVIACEILIHETKLYTDENNNSYLYRPEELARDIKAVEHRIELSGFRTYTSGSLFDYYKKKHPRLTMIIFTHSYVSVWHLKQGQDDKALNVNY